MRRARALAFFGAYLLLGLAWPAWLVIVALRLEPALPATIPLPWILSVYGVGAVVVGSLERSKWLKKLARERKKGAKDA